MRASSNFADKAVRGLVAVAAVSAMFWATMVTPTLWRERATTEVAAAIFEGQPFRRSTLIAIDRQWGDEGQLRAVMLRNLAAIRLRLAEDALRAGDIGGIDAALESAVRMNDAALAKNPSDPFLWLSRFWLTNTRSGFSNAHLSYLRMSYALGPHEGWIQERRSRFALASYRDLPADLAEAAVAEFVDMVRSDLLDKATEIAVGPGAPLRGILFPRLKDVSEEQRRRFAARIYKEGFDDVPIPGIAPPKPEFPEPVLPPGTGECLAC
ncbi:hypothetical protein [Rhodoplanes sp. Z2-YC6860]|uniref:hypothetical protein n=1 Tax=Rhodoplanes sp. Z2-YC6860 TaxID=674703 RepID=UPI00078DE00B|nr:hypothetical protein [Rhodoplanes sp. Z2-YC6860]AMN43762.1 hypothetical protein RHPLAN_53460 [Rhodoplanes sp. Z2-YC6860]